MVFPLKKFVFFHLVEGFLLLAKSNSALSLFWLFWFFFSFFFFLSPLSIGLAETEKNSLD